MHFNRRDNEWGEIFSDDIKPVGNTAADAGAIGRTRTTVTIVMGIPAPGV